MVGAFALVLLLFAAAFGGPSPALAAPAEGSVQTLVFHDLAGDAYAPAIDVLAGIGVVRGLPGGVFEPRALVTREQMAVFVVRLLGYAATAQAVSTVKPPFVDASSIDPWAIGAVNVVQSLGIMSGFPDGAFRPLQTVSEADAITVLVRLLNGAAYAYSLDQPWPASYLKAAGALGLLKSVTLQAPVGSAPVRRDELAQLLFNAGTAGELTYDADGDAILPPAGRQLFAASPAGWTIVQGAVVTGATTGTLTVGGAVLRFAPLVRLVGTSEPALDALIGQTVDYIENASGQVACIAILPTAHP